MSDRTTPSRAKIARNVWRQLSRRGWIEEVVAEAKRKALSLRGRSDAELAANSDHLRLQACETSSSSHSQRLTIAAAASVIEAVRRACRMELFDTQLHAGVIVSCGAVAEMQTGEGKTLSIAFPAFLRSLAGRGVHVATPNAYLAERDCEQLTPVFRLLNTRVGLLRENAAPEQSREAYAADITYGPGYAFGFDYLRDQLTLERFQSRRLGQDVLHRLLGIHAERELLQRGLYAAIIDEVDHVLLDDAVSPLILTYGSDGESPDAEIHRFAKDVASHLTPGRDFQRARNQIRLSDEGFRSVYRHEQWALHPQLIRPWHEYVVLALRARHQFRRDVDYVVRDGKVQIVDPGTGRIYQDRTWSDGLHQAVEARESLVIQRERVAEARITRQRFYRSYECLSGMTGTARGCEREFASVYGLPVSMVPLRKPSQRVLFDEHLSLTRAEKFDAIGEECQAMVDDGRSVLVGTLSIAESHAVADELQRRRLPFDLLNGVQDADEAFLVSQAGQPRAITVATNLAGRGTDIRLHDDVARRGGLHVIIAQPHPLARVDRQLIGRCARCGDPGSARIFLCAEDAPAVDDAPWIARAINRWNARGRKDHLSLYGRVQRVQEHNQRRAGAQRWALLESDREDEKLMQRDISPPHCVQL